MIDVPINELVKHVLLHYKTMLDGMTAYDPSSWEYSPESHQLNLDETTSAISEIPDDWLRASREPYLSKHRRTLCRAFSQYVFDLKKQLGEEWKTENAMLKEHFVNQGLKWKEPPSKKLEIEPNLEWQLRAEIALVSKLGREFCLPFMPPDGRPRTMKMSTDK